MTVEIYFEILANIFARFAYLNHLLKHIYLARDHAITQVPQNAWQSKAGTFTLILLRTLSKIKNESIEYYEFAFAMFVSSCFSIS